MRNVTVCTILDFLSWPFFGEGIPHSMHYDSKVCTFEFVSVTFSVSRTCWHLKLFQSNSTMVNNHQPLWCANNRQITRLTMTIRISGIHISLRQ